MTRDTSFVFRVSEEERRLIEDLARRLERNQSDTIRLLLKGAASQLQRQLPTESPNDDRTSK